MCRPETSQHNHLSATTQVKSVFLIGQLSSSSLHFIENFLQYEKNVKRIYE